jgi:hypothetical protein
LAQRHGIGSLLVPMGWITGLDTLRNTAEL